MARRRPPSLPLDRLVPRAIELLYQSPGGLTRSDLLAALVVSDHAWHRLRVGLDTEGVLVAGKGKSQRHFHPVHVGAAALLSQSGTARDRPLAQQSPDIGTEHQGAQQTQEE